MVAVPVNVVVDNGLDGAGVPAGIVGLTGPRPLPLIVTISPGATALAAKLAAFTTLVITTVEGVGTINVIGTITAAPPVGATVMLAA